MTFETQLVETLEKYIIRLHREIEQLRKQIQEISRSNPGSMYCGKARTQVIATGAITVVHGYYIITPETGVADNLDTLNFVDNNIKQGGKKVFLRTTPGNTITVRDGVDNMDLTGAGGNVVLDDPAKSLVLVYDLTDEQWIVYSVNA